MSITDQPSATLQPPFPHLSILETCPAIWPPNHSQTVRRALETCPGEVGGGCNHGRCGGPRRLRSLPVASEYTFLPSELGRSANRPLISLGLEAAQDQAADRLQEMPFLLQPHLDSPACVRFSIHTEPMVSLPQHH